MKVIEMQFTLDGDDIGHHRAAGLECGPAVLEHARVPDAATDENGVGCGLACEGGRSLARDHLEARCAERIGIGGDHGKAVSLALEGDGLSAARGAHPLDGDRTAACAHIPQQSVWRRAKRCERCGAYFSLGDLAIMHEGIIGEACKARENPRTRRGDAVDGQGIEIGVIRRRSGVGDEGRLPFTRAAHVLKHRDLGSAEAARGEAAGDLRDCRGIGRQHDETHTGLDEGLDMSSIAAMQRERVAIGERPAHTGCGEREGGKVGDDLHLREGDELHQLARHAVIQRVTRGEDDGAAATQRADAVDDC